MSVQTFIKQISALDHSKNPVEKFRDFCELAYCAYAKLTADIQRGEELESRYMQIVGGYRDKDTIRAYKPLLETVCKAVEAGGADFLGVAATEIGALSGGAGQFFTPYSVARCMAEISLTDVGKTIEEKGYITLNEPAAGAGGMVLAAADVMEQQGFSPALHMRVVAQDISQLCFHMCFIQLTFRGIPARVERRNTLSMELFEQAYTPAMLAAHVFGTQAR